MPSIDPERREYQTLQTETESFVIAFIDPEDPDVISRIALDPENTFLHLYPKYPQFNHLSITLENPLTGFDEVRKIFDQADAIERMAESGQGFTICVQTEPSPHVARLLMAHQSRFTDQAIREGLNIGENY